MEAANGVEIPYAASIVFRAPGISPSGAPRCGTALRSSRATDEDEADHGAWSNILCYPHSPNMHAREKEQIRDWLFKGRRKVRPYLFQWISIGKLEFSKLSFWNWPARIHRRLLYCLFLSIALANVILFQEVVLHIPEL